MISIAYNLWSHRARPPICSPLWFRVWLKRIRLAPRLFTQTLIQWRLKRRGAKVGQFALFSSISHFNGRFTNLSVGDHSSIGRIEIALHDLVRIGSCVCINDGAHLLTASHDVQAVDWKQKSAPILIEDFAWIATNAIILPGVTVGRGAVVGAGAVVAKNIPAGAVVVGNPARIVSTERCAELDYSPVSHAALFNAWRPASDIRHPTSDSKDLSNVNGQINTVT